jgi:hypothetical protein
MIMSEAIKDIFKDLIYSEHIEKLLSVLYNTKIPVYMDFCKLMSWNLIQNWGKNFVFSNEILFEQVLSFVQNNSLLKHTTKSFKDSLLIVKLLAIIMMRDIEKNKVFRCF